MTTPSKASARMTPTDAPEPTPAVKRGGRSLRERADAYVEALTLGGLDSMEADESVASSMLAAALDVEEMARALYEHNTAPLTSRGERVLSWAQHIASEEADGEECPYLLTAQTIRAHLLGADQ